MGFMAFVIVSSPQSLGRLVRSLRSHCGLLIVDTFNSRSIKNLHSPTVPELYHTRDCHPLISITPSSQH